VLGKWVGSDGLVYDQWDRRVHVLALDFEPRSVGYAVDPGYTDPFAMLEILTDGDGRMHVSREWYERGKTHDQGITALLGMRRDPSDIVVVDSAEPALIEAMQQKAIQAIPARKGPDSITAGVSKVQARLADPGDGRPRLTVDPSCTNLIAEFETYEWAKNLSGYKDKPKDENNHALDALRYYTQHIDQGPTFYLAGGEAEQEQKQATVPTFAERRADSEWGW